MIRNPVSVAIAGTPIRHGSRNWLYRAIKEAHFEARGGTILFEDISIRTMAKLALKLSSSKS